MTEDIRGTLWIATPAELCRFEGGETRRFSSIEGLPRGSIQALYRGHGSAIWVVTTNGISEIETLAIGQSEFKTTDLDEAAPKLTGAVAQSTDGSLWLGTEAGLCQFAGGRFRAISTTPLPLSSAITTLLLDRQGRLWLGGPKGAFIGDRQGRFGAIADTTGQAVSVLFEDREGSVWIGSGSGVFRIVDGDVQTHAAEHTMTGANVVSFAEDSEGDLWIGTDGQGVTIARDQTFVVYSQRDGLAGGYVRCVFESREGVLWIGTNDGLSRMDHGKFERFTTKQGLSSNVILSLGEDSEGNLLAGTPDGLNCLIRGTFKVITSADGLADDFVRSIYSDPADGSLWIGTRRGLSHYQQNRFRTYAQSDGLGSDLVGAVLRTRDRNLWIATRDGLTRMSNGKFITLRTGDGLSGNVITALHEDGEGGLWIGTQSEGLNYWRNGRLISLRGKEGLPDSVYGIAEDVHHNLWLASNIGIARVRSADLHLLLSLKPTSFAVAWYGTSDGLRIRECSVGGHPEVWTARDQTIWFSTLKGIAALYQSAQRSNLPPPPVIVESVLIDEQTRSPNAAGDIPPGHSRFAFEYAGISFAAPNRVTYQYRLDPFDSNWIDAGTRRYAYYTNIPPGKYWFRVRARNRDSGWDRGSAVMSFNLLPHVYQTFWFYSLLGLSLLLAAYFVYRWRVLEVEARFKAVLHERNRIAREIHDTLAQGFIGVSVQLEIVSRLLASSSESAREHLDQARLLVRESIADARKAIWQMRSQSSEDQDLASRLSKAAALTIGMRGVALSVQVHGAYRPLDSGMEDELVRIGQEAVANALKHASPEKINIELVFQANKLKMTIADDGSGFDQSRAPDPSNGHYGLRGMRERAQQIRATVDIASTVGKGTTVSVEAPLSQ